MDARMFFEGDRVAEEAEGSGGRHLGGAGLGPLFSPASDGRSPPTTTSLSASQSTRWTFTTPPVNPSSRRMSQSGASRARSSFARPASGAAPEETRTEPSSTITPNRPFRRPSDQRQTPSRTVSSSSSFESSVGRVGMAQDGDAVASGRPLAGPLTCVLPSLTSLAPALSLHLGDHTPHADLSEFLDFTGVYEPVWDELSPSPFLGRPGSSSSSFSATDSSSFGSFSTVESSSGRSHPDYSSPNDPNPNYRARAFVDSPPVDFSAFDFPGSPPNPLTSWHSATPYGLAPDSMYDGLAVGVDTHVGVRDWWQTECGIGRWDGSEISSAYPDDRLISEAVAHEAQSTRSSHSVPSHAIGPETHASKSGDRVVAALPKRVNRRPRPTFIPLPSPVHRRRSDPPSHPTNPPDFAAALERIQTQEDRGFRLVLPSFAPRR